MLAFVRRHFRRKQRNERREALKKEQEVQATQERQHEELKRAKRKATIEADTHEHVKHSSPSMGGQDDGQEKEEAEDVVREENGFMSGTDDMVVRILHSFFRLELMLAVRHQGSIYHYL